MRHLWLDGTSIGAVDGDLSTPSPYSRVYLWNQASAGTVWFDDVTVTDTPHRTDAGGTVRAQRRWSLQRSMRLPPGWPR